MLKLSRNSFAERCAGRARVFGAAIILAVAAVLLMPSAAYAQEAPGGTPSEAQSRAAREAHQQRFQQAQQRVRMSPSPGQVVDAEPDEPRFDLRFEGGTVAEYLEAIQEASAKRNIVAMAGTEKVPMPRVALDGVNTQAAVMVLSGMIVEIESSVYAHVSVNTRLEVATVSVEISRPGRGPFAAAQPPQRSTAVHGLAEMLLNGGYTIDAILSAIDVALELSGESDAQLRYHEETRMLFVHGTDLEHTAVRNVLEELSVQATMMPQEEMSEVEGIRFRLEQLNAQVELLDSQIEHEEDALAAIEVGSYKPIQHRMVDTEQRIKLLEERIANGDAGPAAREEMAMHIRSLERATIESERVEAQMRESRLRLAAMKSNHANLRRQLEQATQD